MRRVMAGIPELDEMLGGGFMEGDAVMVAGSAGTGKTTLALQYLVNGATRYGDKGIYVTFEQLPSQLYRDAQNLGWDLRAMEERDQLRIVCTSPELVLDSDGGENVLQEVIGDIQPRRIVIDSLSHFAMYVDEKELRREAYRLLMYLKTKGLSSVSIWETPQMIGQSFSVTELGLSFLVDCILLLRHVEIESSMRKALTVLKMRGSDHDKKLREVDVTSQGIKVSGPFTGYEGVITGSPKKAASERFVEMFRGAARRRSNPPG